MFDIEKSFLDLKKAGIKPIFDDEIFVQVNDTINYWISNHGRLTNNLRKKFYVHKTGDVHWTITLAYKDKRDCYPSELVAEHFLEKPKGKNRIWFVDGDKSNNHYKNLLYVDNQEYYDLSIGKICIGDLGRRQDYKSYVGYEKNKAYRVYNGIYRRCYDPEVKKMYPHYKDSAMCDGWKESPESLSEWYESEWYEIDEDLVVDKDLLFPGNKEYSPSKCCLLPASLNTLLSNYKKHYYREDTILSRKNNNLPLGVRYDINREKYYGQIKIDDNLITLGYKDTKEEAFEDYKRHKEAYIVVIADRYKDKIPKKIYDALLKVRVEPY